MDEFTQVSERLLNRANPINRDVQLGTVVRNAVSEINRIDQALEEFPAILVAAIAGDIAFKITPVTKDTDIVDQNVGVHQVMEVEVEGSVTAAGGGAIDVTITAAGMTGSPKTVAVTVENSDDAAAVATAIKTALDLDADIGHVSTGFFTITRTDAVLTFTANKEAANDTSMSFHVVEDDAVFEELDPLGSVVSIETAGVAPYVRQVLVELVDTDEQLHVWFSGTVPVTVGETTAGDGAAEVVGGLSPEMVQGQMIVNVLLRGTWAAADENVLSVTQKTILGHTVTAVTSTETSVSE